MADRTVNLDDLPTLQQECDIHDAVPIQTEYAECQYGESQVVMPWTPGHGAGTVINTMSMSDSETRFSGGKITFDGEIVLTPRQALTVTLIPEVAALLNVLVSSSRTPAQNLALAVLMGDESALRPLLDQVMETLE